MEEIKEAFEGWVAKYERPQGTRRENAKDAALHLMQQVKINPQLLKVPPPPPHTHTCTSAR
jgi:hypothetical protein